ncbi:MAG: heavy metal sensor histidine kinase [Thermoleophilia bacterium]|nr:heavy metal sensor histidine kinase [Thermoleophilia bacterium]
MPGRGSFRVANRVVAGRAYAVGYDRSEEVEFLARYRRVVAVLMVPSLAVSVAVGSWIVRRGLRPLADIAATVGEIGVDRLGRRVEVRALPREVSDLAGSFNGMLDRIEGAFARLDRFSADIAHELRTPVHNVRNVAEVALAHGRAEGDYREALGACLDEADRLATLIDRLLFLARADDPRRGLRREDVDVAAELGRVLDFYGAAAEEAGVALTLSIRGRPCARLDRPLFQRAVGNLVTNALDHTPRGGHVTLAAAAGPDGLEVSVADDGAGIAEEHLPHVFDRFYRCDAARTPGRGGLGLGLAIARSIAELHGGRASIRSRPGAGTVATLLFADAPARPAEMTESS